MVILVLQLAINYGVYWRRGKRETYTLWQTGLISFGLYLVNVILIHILSTKCLVARGKHCRRCLKCLLILIGRNCITRFLFALALVFLFTILMVAAYRRNEDGPQFIQDFFVTLALSYFLIVCIRIFSFFFLFPFILIRVYRHPY